MSAAISDLTPQLTELNTILSQYPNAEVVLTTNRRMVIRCTDGVVARFLANDLRANDYHQLNTKRGLKTSRYYVQVGFNSPY
jgi:hypothetical protein